jgi:uncharacterized protein (DUF305 family)
MKANASRPRFYRLPCMSAYAALLALSGVSASGCSDDDDDTSMGMGTVRPGTGGTGTGGSSTGTGGSSSGSSGAGGSTGGSGAGGASGSASNTGGSGGTSASDAGTAPPARDTAPLVGDRRIPFSPDNDVEFAQFFAEHHRMAIEMSEHVVERGENAAVQSLAERIISQQTQELEVLEAVLAGAGSAMPPAMPDDPHVEAEMAFMETLSGAELDEMFLLDMIPHHASGLPPAHRAPSQLEREELRTMANDIFEAQSTEIGEMRTLLAELGIMEAGEDRGATADERPDFGLQGDRRVPLTPRDWEFVDFFISHHEMAVVMAEHELENGDNEEVIAMAQSMRDAQTEELETLRRIRTELAGSAGPPSMPADPHADPEMMEMLSTTGAELDRMFLTEMIPHHASGLPTAHRATPHVQNEELRTLADEMYQAQSEEIGEMKELLDALP